MMYSYSFSSFSGEYSTPIKTDNKDIFLNNNIFVEHNKRDAIRGLLNKVINHQSVTMIQEHVKIKAIISIKNKYIDEYPEVFI